MMTGIGWVWVALSISWIAGVALAGGFLPRGRPFLVERIGWGVALGLGALASGEAARLGSSTPSWSLVPFLFLVFCIGGTLTLRGRRSPAGESLTPFRLGPGTVLLVVAIAAGVLLYALYALAEPMWSNDFLAIWGLKAKAIALARDGRIPQWLFDPHVAGFSHPEYPLGLPLVFAGLAGLAHGWDDQALALLYPVLQVATLLVVFGWLRRRGATTTLALAAAALVAWFEPLYSAFLTGMAEVPVSLAILLVGVSLSDALDATDGRALARLGAATFLAASIKNEGLFVAAAAAVIALFSRAGKRRRWMAAAASIVPALVPTLAFRLVRGPAPLRDFDLGLVSPGRWSELLPRVGRALSADVRLGLQAVPILALLAVLYACGRRTAWADRLLLLGLSALAAYLVLPAFAVMGPDWLVQTTLPRTAAALVPLAAAGLAGRLAGVYSPAAAVPAAVPSER